MKFSVITRYNRAPDDGLTAFKIYGDQNTFLRCNMHAFDGFGVEKNKFHGIIIYLLENIIIHYECALDSVTRLELVLIYN